MNLPDQKKIGRIRYTVGKITSILPGFGIGHMIQGRYMTGLGFALLDSLSHGALVMLGLPLSLTPSEEPIAIKIMSEIGLYALLFCLISIRFFEIKSAFNLHEIVERGSFQRKPFYTYNTNSSHRKMVQRTLVFSLRYQF